MEDSGERLIPFLRGLAASIERRELSPARMQSVGEFYMSQQFREQARRDGHTTPPTSATRLGFCQRDLVKFITVGWYLYCCLLGEYDLGEVADTESSDTTESDDESDRRRRRCRRRRETNKI